MKYSLELDAYDMLLLSRILSGELAPEKERLRQALLAGDIWGAETIQADINRLTSILELLEASKTTERGD
jgi:hypothetical protein